MADLLADTIKDISELVSFRQKKGFTQKDVALAMDISEDAVEQLEKRLLNHDDISFRTLEGYCEAVGLSMNLSFQPERRGSGLFDSAADAIKSAVHSSACEGMTTSDEDIKNLWRLARNEITADELIKQYIDEAIAEDRAARMQ